MHNNRELAISVKDLTRTISFKPGKPLDNNRFIDLNISTLKL